MTDDLSKNNQDATDNATGSNSINEPDQAPPPEPIYQFVCHPARKNLMITALTTIFILVCIVIVWFIAEGSLFLTGLSVLILFGALGSFYFPTWYYIYEDHLVIRSLIQTLRKDWSQFRSYYADKNGVLLSPFARPTRLENFRGTYIKCFEHLDKVMEIVKEKIDFEKDDE